MLNSYNNPDALRQSMAVLYDRVRHKGRYYRFMAKLLHKPIFLESLDRCQFYRQSYAGVMSVPLAEITGDENPKQDFDYQFHPMMAKLKNRWVNVAVAKKMGVCLPLVTLLRIGPIYFVRDGHHRISVAKVMGEEFIDAEVTNLDCVSIPADNSAACIIEDCS